MASMASSFTRGGRAGCSGFRPMPLAQRASSSDAASMENRANTTLVVVESPTKAKKVQKFLTKPDEEEDERSLALLESLGKVEVLASYGHVRDLEGKPGAVDPDKHFALRWSVSSRARPRLDAIKQAAQRCERVLLATDPDREGEGIAWHLQQELEACPSLRGRAGKPSIQRITFNEVTSKAVLRSLEGAREVSTALVDAYRARRALDHLVGFGLSPVLWRKLPGSKSAGRVQSAALRMICERDDEISAHVPVEYWSVSADVEAGGHSFEGASLVALGEEKLGKFSLATEEDAERARAAVESAQLSLTTIKETISRKQPRRPLTTSTLQQLASSRLGMSATETMAVAQKLYEGDHAGGTGEGLITYMRTDGTYLSPAFVQQCREYIEGEFGGDYLPQKPRLFASKSKNAQEAHEAIRPTNPSLSPSKLKKKLEPRHWRLYDLIWRVAVGSQMSDARAKTLSFEFSGDGVTLRSAFTATVFEGHLAADAEGAGARRAALEKMRALESLGEGDACEASGVVSRQHHTSPPPKFSDGTLVKALEECGIGRPSTYAPIIKVLTSRGYVVRSSGRLVPTARGHLVTKFLKLYFPVYVDLNYTSGMEEQLDRISNAELGWTLLLSDFWDPFERTVADVMDIRNRVVIDELDALFGDDLVKGLDLGEGEGDGEVSAEPRRCPACGTGTLGLKLSRFGGFVGCSNYDKKGESGCTFGVPLDMCFGSSTKIAKHGFDLSALGELGACEDTGLVIEMKLGPYGYYLHRTDGMVASLPREIEPSEMTPKDATEVLREKGKRKKKKAAASTGAKAKGKAQGRGGGANKRSPNPFIEFMQREKDRVVQENPDKTWRECVKIIAAEYKTSASAKS